MAKNNLKIIVIILFLISTFIYLPYENVEAYGNDTSLDDVDASFIAESIGIYNNGSSASIVGDVNGDGFDDIVIVKSYAMKVFSYHAWMLGKAYLFFGNNSGWNKDFNMANADATFFTKNNYDRFDLTVAGLGDVNKDGYDDFLIGAPGNCEIDHCRGKAHLIFGKPVGWVKDFNLSNADVSFIGEESWDCSGASVARAGDVNGDGYNDFLINAPWNGMEWIGKTYLIFGQKKFLQKNVSLVNANASFTGEDGMTGISLAGGGDVNKDGYDDFLIGAPSYDYSGYRDGKSYLILGKKTGWMKNYSLANADASFLGVEEEEYAGCALSNSGDINKDGYDDILIGGHGSYWDGTSKGRTYLIFGRTLGWQKNMSLTNANASFIGENEGDYSGAAISSSGDVNGDGFDDIIIGAPGRKLDNFEGQTYVFLGKSSGWNHNISLATSNASFIGEGFRNESGSGICSAGDVNNDGFDDILISTRGNNSGMHGSNVLGQSYLIFYDTNTKPTSISSVTFYSNVNYTTQATKGYIDQTIYVELIGTDGDPVSANVAEAQINSSKTDPYGVELRLHETGLNTGKYRGSFEIASVSSQYHTRIGATYGEIIQVTSKQNSNKFDTLLVKVSDIKLLPENDNTTAIEDQFYNQKYSCIGASEELVAWTYESNAFWLNWETTNHTLWGTPTNDEVGQYWVRINISYNNEYFDEHNFTLTVVNVNDPPEIIGAPTKLEIPAYEDYTLDFSNYIVDVDNTTEELRVGVGSKYVVVNGLNITFNYPNSVDYEKVYIVATDGIAYANTHVLNNTVIAKELPVILDKSPIGENVTISSNISIMFSHPMNKTSVEAAFTVLPNIAGNFSWNANDIIMIFAPQAELERAQEYTVNLSSTAKNQNGSPLDGNMNELIDAAPLDDYTWTFKTVATPNYSPLIKIDSPDNNSVYNVNDTIYFDCVNTTDPDGDLLEFLWYSNISGILSNEPKFNLNLPVGHHLIMLFVNDNHNHNVSTTLNIIVIPYNRPPIPIIDSPNNNDVFNTTDIITFDGTSSSDPDNDILNFFWFSNISGGFGYSSKFDTKLPAGRHRITLFVNDRHYHNVSVSIYITVLNESDGSINGPNNIDNPPKPEQDKNIIARFGSYSIIVIIITIIIIAGFVASTEIGKFGLMGLFVPLYSRLKGKKVLDHETRGMIRGYVMANPGDHYNNIKRTIGLQNGALTYHLRVLEREELIKSQRDGIYKRFYPVEMRVPENVMQLSKIQETILNEIIEQPGISERELGKELEVSPRVINYHIKKLISANLIKLEKLGKKTKYYVLDDSKII